jgi:hypothetical protein
MHWVRIVQEEAFAAELHFLLRNLPLPNESKIASYNPFWKVGSSVWADDYSMPT